MCVSLYRVSNHRQHHLHTDTPLDPHSPYEGFWWSHMGWLVANPQVTGLHILDVTQYVELLAARYLVT